MQHSVPQLVIFDCDGVLVDSEPISIAVLRESIATAGGKVSEAEAYRRFLGRSMASVRDILRLEFGLTLSTLDLDRMRAEIARRFGAELQPMPGIVEALTGLGMRRCVASSSHSDRIRMALSLTGLLEMLEPHIYSATMVSRGKPAPDLFLHAAREMRVEPADCVVVEDSPAGIDAAHAAGMRVFAFLGGSHAANEAHRAELARRRPDLTFSDMRRLPDLLAGLGRQAS